MNRLRWAIGVALVLVGYSTQGAAQEAFTLPDGKVCQISIGRQQEVRIGDERIVVQPDAVEWQGTDLLILGGNGFTYREDTPGKMTVVRRIAGVLVKANGRVILVPPVQGTLGFELPRVVADRRNGWDVLFSDSTPGPDSWKRIWHVHLDGTRWSGLDSITSLPARFAITDNPSALRRTAAGRLVFAIRARYHAGDRILGLFQGAKQWRVDTLARGPLIGYFDLLPTRNGLVLAAAMIPLAMPHAPMGLRITDSTGNVWSEPRLLAEKQKGAARPQFVPAVSYADLVWHLSGSSRMVDSASVWAAAMATDLSQELADPFLVWEGVANGGFDPLYFRVRDIGTLAVLREPVPDSMLKIVSISKRAVVARLALPANTFSFAVASRDHRAQFVQLVVSGIEQGNLPHLERQELSTGCSEAPKRRSPPQHREHS